QLSATAWTNRDLVSLGDHDKDGAVDMVWRDFNTSRLLLRHGKPATGGGTELTSLASAVNSKNGVDAQYGTSWNTTNIPLLTGTPDITKDGIPEMWAVTGAADNGIVRFYPGGATHHGTPVGVISTDWRTKKALG
ncbi:VCBS repeat-containing protein, partial [Streptomyces sp. NPDC003691]